MSGRKIVVSSRSDDKQKLLLIAHFFVNFWEISIFEVPDPAHSLMYQQLRPF